MCGRKVGYLHVGGKVLSKGKVLSVKGYIECVRDDISYDISL